MEIADIVGLIKDVVTTLATIIAACVAVEGLSTWRRQLQGNAEYEQARRLLRATYEIRESVRYFRNPFMSSQELAAALSEEGIDPQKASTQESQAAAYQVRWKKIADAHVTFSAELLEAEALWGEKIAQAGKTLLDCVRDLNVAVRQWLNGRDLSPKRFDYIYNAIFDGGDESEFTTTLNSAIADMETELRPHLLR